MVGEALGAAEQLAYQETDAEGHQHENIRPIDADLIVKAPARRPARRDRRTFL